MTVHKRGNYYHVEFQFKGQQVRRSARTTSKRRAEEFERKLRQDLHDHHILGKPVVRSMTLGEAAERYLKDLKPRRQQKGRTAQSEAYKISRLVGLLGEDLPLSRITVDMIADMKAMLAAEGISRADGKKAGMAPGTINRGYLAPLKAILRKAHSEWGALAAVPQIKLYQLNNKRTRWLRPEEEVRLLAACDDAPHLRDLVVFLMETGARRGEATGLTWDHVDLSRKPRGLVRFIETKSGKPRSVPLSRRSFELLQRLHKDRPKDQPHVFLSWHPKWKEGRHSPHAVPFYEPRGAWDKIRKRAGLEDFKLHDLRHTFASRLVQRGASLFAVSKLLGHAKIDMTTRYAHLAPDELDAAIGRLDEFPAKPATPAV